MQFSVDLGELQRVIDSLDTFGTTLQSKINELDQVNAQLHQTWQGQAAVAQKAAHDKLHQGALEVHRGLQDMHAAATQAHQNYQAAIEANLQTWSQLQ